MKIGILCACAPEFEPYRKALGGDARTVCGAKVIEGTLCAKEVAVLFCGIGKVNAAIGTSTLVRSLNCDRVIMSGAAGAIAKGLHIGDCVMVSDCIYHDLDPQLICDYHPESIDPDFKCAEDIVSIGTAAGMRSGRNGHGRCVHSRRWP